MGSVILIDWSAGEVRDGAPAVPGVYTSVLENVYLDEQKQLNIRKSSKYLTSIKLPPYSIFKRSFFSYKANKMLIAYEKNEKTVLLAVDMTDMTSYSSYVNYTGEAIFFIELPEESNQINDLPTILIFGLDILYKTSLVKKDGYLIIDKFVTTNSVYGESNIINPVDGVIFQGRLYVACDGPNLSGSFPKLRSMRILASIAYQYNNFTIGTTPESSAIDLLMSYTSGESIYAIGAGSDALMVVSSIGLRIIRASNEISKILSNVNIMEYPAGWADSARCRPVSFFGFLIFASKRTLRAKLLSSVESGYSSSVDLSLPLLTNFTSNIFDVSIDLVNQSLYIVLEDGSIHTITTQTISIPSKSFNMSLPSAKSFFADGLLYKSISNLNPSYIITMSSQEGKDANVYLNISELNYNEKNGYLHDSVVDYYWRVTIIAKVRKGRFNLIFDNPPKAFGIIGIWLEVEHNMWVFAYTDENSYKTSKFGCRALDMFNYNNRVVRGICVFYDNAFNSLPIGYSTIYSAAEFIFQCIDELDEEYSYEYYYSAPILSIGEPNADIHTDKIYYGQIKLKLSLSCPMFALGWRSVSNTNFSNSYGGNRCLLLSENNNAAKHIEFYTENSSNTTSCINDVSEINFNTVHGSSYKNQFIRGSVRDFDQSGADSISFSRLVIYR